MLNRYTGIIMFNPYLVIISIFTLTGLLAAIWGWRIILNGRRSLDWPSVEGVITESSHNSQTLLPDISFSYTIAGSQLQSSILFAGDISPSEEFSQSYIKNFPVGKEVQVYYEPDNPSQVTLEPGPKKGDAIVFVIGALTFVFGIIFLFANT